VDSNLLFQHNKLGTGTLRVHPVLLESTERLEDALLEANNVPSRNVIYNSFMSASMSAAEMASQCR